MKTSCPEHLLGLRRSGQPTPEETAMLEQHLQSCGHCALMEGLHDDFAKAVRRRAADKQLIANAVEGALLARAGRAPRGRRSWTLAAAAGLAFAITGGLASAGIWAYRAAHNPLAAPKADSDRSTTHKALPRPRGAEAAGAPEGVAPEGAAPDNVLPEVGPEVGHEVASEVAHEVTPETAPPEAAAPVPAAPVVGQRIAAPAVRAPGRGHGGHRRVAAVEAQPAVSPMDLETLFASANEARRAGQSERAGELYQELQRRFPESREALLSLVSYGRILLDHGRPEQALAQFERHIKGASGGVLVADALYGKARALTALHRQADARRCWNELLVGFPDSIYADTARAQLGQGPGAKP